MIRCNLLSYHFQLVVLSGLPLSTGVPVLFLIFTNQISD